MACDGNDVEADGSAADGSAADATLFGLKGKRAER